MLSRPSRNDLLSKYKRARSNRKFLLNHVHITHLWGPDTTPVECGYPKCLHLMWEIIDLDTRIHCLEHHPPGCLDCEGGVSL